MADGSIIFEAKVDQKALDKDLRASKKKIMDIENSIYKNEQKKLPLIQQSKELSTVLDEAKAKLYEMQAAEKGTYTASTISEQRQHVSGLQSEYNAVESTIERINAKLADSNMDLELEKQRAGQIQIELAKSADEAGQLEKNTKKSSKAMQEMEKRTRRFGTRMREIVTGALFFNLISRAMTSMVQWTGNVIRSNAEASASIAQLKGALLTLAQPILNVVIPAFIYLVNILTQVIAAIASVVSRLFGTTAKKSAEAAKSLNKQASGYGGVAKQAKEATKSLMAFDELNTLQAEQDNDSGGGGGIGGAISPDFGIDFDAAEKGLNMILGLVGAIGLGLAAWKLASIFTDPKTAAGIGLVVGGLTLLAVSIWDVAQNGFTLENTLGIIGGLLATGLGISLITGTWIPLLVAGIAAVLLAITVATGHGDELISGFKTLLSGFIDFFVGIFTGDLERAIGGISKIVDGFREIFFAVLSGVEDMFLSFLNWLDEKTGGKFHGIIEFAKGIVTGFSDFVRDIFNGIFETVERILTGIVEFIAGVFTMDWDMALNGLKTIVEGVVSGIKSLFDSLVSWLTDILQWIDDAFMSRATTQHSGGGRSFGETSSTAYTESVASYSVPHLARGAVIPPNREFLAVLGDQRHGTNIEAPLETIKQAVAEVIGADTELMREQNDLLRQILSRTGVYLDGREITNTVNKYQREMARARGW